MHIHIHTYTHAYIHTYMDDAWMHTYIPGPRRTNPLSRCRGWLRPRSRTMSKRRRWEMMLMMVVTMTKKVTKKKTTKMILQ